MPEDIEVAGFDDVPMASYFNPSLTTVKQPVGAMGEEAANKLMELIENNSTVQKDIVCPHQIIIRGSSADKV